MRCFLSDIFKHTEKFNKLKILEHATVSFGKLIRLNITTASGLNSNLTQ